MNFNPIYQWVRETVKCAGKNPFVLGMNGPQGAGKSTLSRALCERLEADGLRAVAVSVDDFYLTHAEQKTLAAQHPSNPYLQQRGYPGTHDIELGVKILREIKSGSVPVLIPRYDKSAHHGKGDRLPMLQWTKVSGPVELIILEGWMLGFSPVQEKSLPNQDFGVINQFLGAYEAWHKMLDGFLQLQPDDYRHVLKWRVEAEEKMKAEGKAGMSKENVLRYAQLFLPAYSTYLPGLSAAPPVKENVLVVPVGIGRLR